MGKERDYEKNPFSEEEMNQRYRNWADWLASLLVTVYQVGKETGGEKFMSRIKEEFYKQGQKGAKRWLSITGTKLEDYTNCQTLCDLQDFIDDLFANYWKGHAEKSDQAFEKDLYTCPFTKQFSKEPEICSIIVGESTRGMYEALNPQYKFSGFSKLLTKGEGACRIRVELEK